MIKHTLKTLFILYIALFLLTACGDIPLRQWLSHHAQVLDFETGKPLKDVVVLARWVGEKSMLVDTQSTCYHVETATTDKNGWFEIPSYNEGLGKGNIYNKRFDLSFYREGYFFDARVRHNDRAKKIQMKPFYGAEGERFKFISNFSTSCREAGGSYKKAYKLVKRLYKEAKALANTPEELKDAKWLRKILASTVDTSYRDFTGEEQVKKINEILKDYELKE